MRQLLFAGEYSKLSSCYRCLRFEDETRHCVSSLRGSSLLTLQAIDHESQSEHI